MSNPDKPFVHQHAVPKGVVATRWWWVRHAPVREDGGCIYGQKDIGCDTGDREVFEAVAKILPRNAVWVASNLKRTHQTAEAIWDAGFPRHKRRNNAALLLTRNARVPALILDRKINKDGTCTTPSRTAGSPDALWRSPAIFCSRALAIQTRTRRSAAAARTMKTMRMSAAPALITGTATWGRLPPGMLGRAPSSSRSWGVSWDGGCV